MKTHDQQPQRQSRTLDANPKASRQASWDVILQKYTTRNNLSKSISISISHENNRAIQRMKIDNNEATQLDLEGLEFPKLALLEGERLRFELGLLESNFADPYTTNHMGSDFSIENLQDLTMIKDAYFNVRNNNSPILYEFMVEQADADKSITIPGLDSCLGITVINTIDFTKIGGHFVTPFDLRTLQHYHDSLNHIVDFTKQGGTYKVIFSGTNDNLAGHKNRFADHKSNFSAGGDGYLLDAELSGQILNLLTQLSGLPIIVHDSHAKIEDQDEVYGNKYHQIDMNGNAAQIDPTVEIL